MVWIIVYIKLVLGWILWNIKNLLLVFVFFFLNSHFFELISAKCEL